MKENKNSSRMNISQLNQTRFTDCKSFKKFPSLISTFKSQLEYSSGQQNTIKTYRKYQNLTNRVFNEILNSPFNSTNLELSSGQRNYMTDRNFVHNGASLQNSSIKPKNKINDCLNEHVMMLKQDIIAHTLKKTQYIIRLDELDYAIQKLSNQNDDYYLNWMAIYNTENKIKSFEDDIILIKENIKTNFNKQTKLKQKLYKINKEYLFNSIDNTASTSRLQPIKEESNLINHVIKQHEILREKLSGNKTNFIQNMIFNMRVLLPQSIVNPSLSILYKKILEEKLVKKFILVTKKQTNGLNTKQVKLVQDFLKFLSEIESKNIKKKQKIFAVQAFEEFKNKVDQILKDIALLQVQANQLSNNNQQLLEIQNSLKSQLVSYKNNIADNIQKENNELQKQYQEATQQKKDFSALLQQKYQTQFIRYIKFIQERESVNTLLKKCMSFLEVNNPNTQSQSQSSS